MIYTILGTAKEITDALFDDIENEISTNSHGELISEYYAFLKRNDDEFISVQLTRETNGLTEEEYFYSVHLVDNITGKDCELYTADKFCRTSVFNLISEIMKNIISEIILGGDVKNDLQPI